MSERIALFHNFTSEPFTYPFDGKEKTFPAGARVYMPEGLARHFAKHLTNQELLKSGNENDTSPKDPEKNATFTKVFNKAFILDTGAPEQDETDLAIELATKAKEAEKAQKIEEEDEFEGLDEDQTERTNEVLEDEQNVRETAKKLGIKSWHLLSVDKLKAKIEEATNDK